MTTNRCYARGVLRAVRVPDESDVMTFYARLRSGRTRQIGLAGAATLLALIACLVGPSTASAAVSPVPPFSQCPAVGQSPSCQILVVINADRSVTVYGDPAVGPYDGGDDTLVGVVNNSSDPVNAITVTGPGTGLAGLDGDGLCTFGVAGCPFGTTGYEGPGTSIVTDVTRLPDSAEIDFSGGLRGGSTAYFSLEGALTSAQLTARQGTLTGTVPYVAFGDSITTGGSVPNCHFSAATSPWGCTTTSAVPYPDRVAATLGYSYTDDAAKYKAAAPAPPSFDLFRVGIWGYTVEEAAADEKNGSNAQGGPWLPQLTAVGGAQKLVTGSLGINDLHFDDVKKWLGLFTTSEFSDRVTTEAANIIQNRSADFDAMFNALDAAKTRGAKIIVTLYYNPYDTFMDRCLVLKTISTRLLNVVDGELSKRAQAHGFLTVDFRPVFQAHGAGSSDPYVFGTQCKAASAVSDWLPKWLGGGGGGSVVDQKFDPHPNNKGTQAMADAILKVAK